MEQRINWVNTTQCDYCPKTIDVNQHGRTKLHTSPQDNGTIVWCQGSQRKVD